MTVRPRRFLRRRRSILVAVVLLTALGVFFARPFSFWMAGHVIRSRFSDAPSLTTLELAGWLRDSGRRAPLLLDVRETVEYEVSHLPEAVSVPLSANVPSLLESPDRGLPMVVYCSMGYRSAMAVRQLRAAGFTNAVTLEGGIFQWANEGREVERRGEPVQEVHPYSRAFAWLLKRRAP